MPAVCRGVPPRASVSARAVRIEVFGTAAWDLRSWPARAAGKPRDPRFRTSCRHPFRTVVTALFEPRPGSHTVDTGGGERDGLEPHHPLARPGAPSPRR